MDYVGQLRRDARRNGLRGRSTRWRAVDRYIDGRLAGFLRGLDGVGGARTDFGDCAGVCACAVLMVLVACCGENRWMLRRFGLSRPGDLDFPHLNNGMCGLYGWVTAAVWNTVGAGGAEMVVFPGAGGGSLRAHAFVRHAGLLYDGGLGRYRLRFEPAGARGGKDCAIARAYEDGEYVGTCAIGDAGSEFGKHWCRKLWFPWSTLRARRIVGAVVRACGASPAPVAERQVAAGIAGPQGPEG